MIPSIPIIEEAFLKIVGKEPINTSKVIQNLKKHFGLSKEDLDCLTACGRQKRFDNRVIYVRTKLIRDKKLNMDKQRSVWLLNKYE